MREYTQFGNIILIERRKSFDFRIIKSNFSIMYCAAAWGIDYLFSAVNQKENCGNH